MALISVTSIGQNRSDSEFINNNPRVRIDYRRSRARTFGRGTVRRGIVRRKKKC